MPYEQRVSLHHIVSRKDCQSGLSADRIWTQTVMKLFAAAEQWPYRTSLLFHFVEFVNFKHAQRQEGSLDPCGDSLHTAFFFDPETQHRVDLHHVLGPSNPPLVPVGTLLYGEKGY